MDKELKQKPTQVQIATNILEEELSSLIELLKETLRVSHNHPGELRYKRRDLFWTDTAGWVVYDKDKMHDLYRGSLIEALRVLTKEELS